jgi:uncharacterized phage protein (TIGR02216 family)
VRRSPMREATPWRALLAAAAQLGVAPAAFWRLSLREWRAIAGAHVDALSREAFHALATRFPDEIG